MASAEREPLLSSTSAQTLLASPPQTQNLNQVSGAKLYWILGAIWTVVFLGALDGNESFYMTSGLRVSCLP
jgi:hypothetical protein